VDTDRLTVPPLVAVTSVRRRIRVDNQAVNERIAKPSRFVGLKDAERRPAAGGRDHVRVRWAVDVRAQCAAARTQTQFCQELAAVANVAHRLILAAVTATNSSGSYARETPASSPGRVRAAHFRFRSRSDRRPLPEPTRTSCFVRLSGLAVSSGWFKTMPG